MRRAALGKTIVAIQSRQARHGGEKTKEIIDRRKEKKKRTTPTSLQTSNPSIGEMLLGRKM